MDANFKKPIAIVGAEKCPVCTQAVETYRGGEGTSHCIPLEHSLFEDRAKGLRETILKLEKEREGLIKVINFYANGIYDHGHRATLMMRKLNRRIKL